jgi:hypothetical protein
LGPPFRLSGGALAAFQYPKKQVEYQGYRSGTPDRTGLSKPVLIGAALIATAILLSALITIVGTRFVGMDSPTEDSVWLIDRLTGSVCRCRAAETARPRAIRTPRRGASATEPNAEQFNRGQE